MTFIAIGAIALAATVLRLLHLGRQSFWIDECDTMTVVQQSWPAFWHTLWQGEANMMAYYLLIRAWIHLGTAEPIVRGVSVIAGVATIFAIYFLGKRLFSVRAGLVAALLLAVNACHVAYSQEARGYALLLLLCTLSMLTFVNAVEHSTTTNWLLYVLLTATAVYTQFLAGLFIVAEWASLVFFPRRALDLKRLSLSALLLAILLSPAVWIVLHKDAGQLQFIPRPSLLDLYHLLLFLTSYGGKTFGALLAVLYVASLGASLALFSAAWRQSRQSIEGWRLALLLSCLATPVFLDMTISHFGKQIFFYRYLLICLPALSLLAARGFCCVRSQRVAAVGLLATCALSLTTIWRYYAIPKENWKSATQYLLLNKTPEDPVIFYPWWAQQPLHYYQEQFRVPPDTLHLIPAQFYSARTPALHRPEVVWLISCRQDSYLQSFRKDVAQVYPYHHELRYDGPVVLEEYSSQDLAAP